MVDQRLGAVSQGLSLLAASVWRGGNTASNLRPERARLDGGCVKLSVIIPARNEAESISQTLEQTASTLDAAGIDYEILVIDDASTDETPGIVRSLGDMNARIRYLRSPYPSGFGFTVRYGLDAFEGDAVAVMMADASDSPDDLVVYHRLLESGYDCAFGSRFVRGARVHDYPRPKLVLNR